MSVIQSEPVFYRGYNGWRQQQYPIAYWWGVVTVVGDGSGTSATARLVFNTLGEPRNSRLYSLEYYDLSGLAGANTGELQVVATGFQGPGANSLGNVFSFVNRLVTDKGDQSRLGIQAADYGRMPVFLGGQEILQLGDQTFSMQRANVNGDTTILNAGGYVWSPRSILANGGPQRPPGGLYGV